MTARPENVVLLTDCDNFYAACEKLFRPDLRNTPLLILGSNDGCVISRSAESKALGIKMGVPVFQIKDEIKRHGIKIFSPNFALYSDVSNRVMTTLESMSSRCEIYSIDEGFCDLTGAASAVPLLTLGREIKATIGKWVGVPVSCGIAQTKTLAKLASRASKKYPATGGVVDLTDPVRQRKLMALTEVGDVWGVGRKISARLNAAGVYTALDLANCNPRVIRDQYSVVLERTVHELNRVPCIEFEEVAPTKKQLICSRSFGNRITEFHEMREAITSFITRATEKLRNEGQEAKIVTVFIRTSPFNQNEPHYSNSATGELSVPSADTRDMIELANRLLVGIWREGFRYAKGGVMLFDFYDPGTYQPALFDEPSRHDNGKELMSVIDSINSSGVGKVFFGAQGAKRVWEMKREHLSPAYTTRWADLPTVR